MMFGNLNGEIADNQGGCYGGLHFFQDDTERLLVGESWLRINWSVDDKVGGQGGEINLLPVTLVVTNEWHTMVTRIDYSPGGNAAVKVWLDPDFNQMEANQPHVPQTFSMNNTFNQHSSSLWKWIGLRGVHQHHDGSDRFRSGFCGAPAHRHNEHNQLGWKRESFVDQHRDVAGSSRSDGGLDGLGKSSQPPNSKHD
jgi:hypothetical protein